jgi:hypothetical protein
VNTGKLLFSQLMDFRPWTSFARSVARYGGDSRVRSLCCAEQFRAQAFAQLTYRESLPDIETCLSAQMRPRPCHGEQRSYDARRVPARCDREGYPLDNIHHWMKCLQQSNSGTDRASGALEAGCSG